MAIGRGEGSEEEKGGGFFVLLVEKVEDEGFFSFFQPRRSKMRVLRTRKIEEPPSSKNPAPIFEEVAPPLPVFRSIFDLFFAAEDRRLGGVRRSSGPKIEEAPIYDLRPRNRRTPLHLRSSEPKIGSKIAIGPVVECI